MIHDVYAIGDNATIEDLNGRLLFCEVDGCHSEATHVIINTKQPGFCPVCDWHRELWGARRGMQGVRVVTVAEFEAERRLGLYDPR